MDEEQNGKSRMDQLKNGTRRLNFQSSRFPMLGPKLSRNHLAIGSEALCIYWLEFTSQYFGERLQSYQAVAGLLGRRARSFASAIWRLVGH